MDKRVRVVRLVASHPAVWEEMEEEEEVREEGEGEGRGEGGENQS